MAIRAATSICNIAILKVLNNFNSMHIIDISSSKASTQSGPMGPTLVGPKVWALQQNVIRQKNMGWGFPIDRAINLENRLINNIATERGPFYLFLDRRPIVEAFMASILIWNVAILGMLSNFNSMHFTDISSRKAPTQSGPMGPTLAGPKVWALQQNVIRQKTWAEGGFPIDRAILKIG